ncbi:glycine betaine uptake BCCT transporter [Orenia marismortui]|uniref:Glycine betaine transporter n=1 Tax=Orenia marismortui TaxID=46469 RepID=A0A4R8HA30_9FIRM|nr:BCCT family transporter [Orenia marismortui]TDX52679.1 glycine betaine transporter [Orenia marismortui]
MKHSIRKEDNNVFYISLIITFIVVIWGIFDPGGFANVTNSIFEFLVTKFGWFYLLSMFIFVIFAIGIAFSKYGRIKLGSDDSKPEYSNISWFAMLFSAGMGIGLVFWGVAEPLNHFINPQGLEGGSPVAANFAMKTSFFHWGLHPWSNYSILALALAYFQFRKNRPGLVSSVFIPLLGENASKGIIGHSIDVLAVVATVAGVATSLGLGTLQINSGLNYLFGLPTTTIVQIIIITTVTILFMLSAVTGLDRGIKILSNTNLMIAIVLLVLAIILGPTVKIFKSFTSGLGAYLNEFIKKSLEIRPYRSNQWLGDWTIFYWAWWIAWAPFVGTFIARISRGRRIKEFLLGVTVVPSLGSFVWFATFGTLGIDLGPKIAQKAIKTTETAFFVVMNHYPLGNVISFVAVILLCTFFVTSADSATFVLGMMSSNGGLDPTTRRKLIWGIIQSLLALSLMLAGGLKTLQIASIAAAFPFAVVMVIACFSLLKALRNDEFIKKLKNK